MEYARLLRQRPVMVLWLARSLSALGDRLYAMAVMWSVWAGTGSASLTGLVALLESLPYVVLGVLGRRVVARFSSYGALCAVDALRAGVAVALPFAWSPDARGTAVVLGGVCALGVLGALFDPNFEALVPGLGHAGQVQSLTGLFDLTSRVARITGHACAGALLLVISKSELFTCVGAAFAVSAAALGGMARRLPPPTRAASAARVPAVRVTALVRERPDIGLAIGVHGAVPLCVAATTIGLPALLAHGHDTRAGAYGLITAVSGIGTLIGNPVAGGLRPRAWLAVCCAAWAVDGLATASMAVAGSDPALGALCLLSGLAVPVGTVTMRARLGMYPPAERLRLMAVEHTATRAGTVVAILLLPPLVDASPAGAFLTAGTVVALLTGAVGLSGPGGRRGGAPAPVGPAESR
ncbi:MFS transporter [Streptomyces sp. UNOB3_S3]|uniref:MFS transporter n=1 Tax=Streptomyces sp. UNOB3_S3 TaxID=2871682 RepID=UPI001E3607C1|nr:MFS transporter [Streptomyces sp. UNOB3_S3]MCC3773687.1 MFS transporter [Streptomyces sp. UNOB3_S3]